MIVVLGIVLLYYVLLKPDNITRLFHKTRLTDSSHPKISLLLSSLDEFHPKQARILLAWCVVFFLTFTVQLYLLVSAFEPISPVHSFAASSSAMFVKTLLPISLGDLGIRESAAVYFFGLFGIKRASAFNASFILFSINILMPSLVGLFILLRNRLNGSGGVKCKSQH